jgi:hypothetical protein
MTKEQFDEMNALYKKRFAEIKEAEETLRTLQSELHKKFLAVSEEYEAKVSEYYKINVW